MKKKATLHNIRHFTIVIEADETGGYYAFCPSLPGCYSQGETLEEARQNAQEAIQCHLESLVNDGQPLPKERDEFIGTVKVTVPALHGR